MQKKHSNTIGAQIAAMLGSSPADIFHSCGMTGGRRGIDQGTEIKGMQIFDGHDDITGKDTHSAVVAEFDDGNRLVSTRGAVIAGNLGIMMSPAEYYKMCVGGAIAAGCEVTYKGKKLSA